MDSWLSHLKLCHFGKASLSGLNFLTCEIEKIIMLVILVSSSGYYEAQSVPSLLSSQFLS